MTLLTQKGDLLGLDSVLDFLQAKAQTQSWTWFSGIWPWRKADHHLRGDRVKLPRPVKLCVGVFLFQVDVMHDLSDDYALQ